MLIGCQEGHLPVKHRTTPIISKISLLGDLPQPRVKYKLSMLTGLLSDSATVSKALAIIVLLHSPDWTLMSVMV